MEQLWQRPQTVKRYLHPPKAERLFTFWREGKIMFGENQFPTDTATAVINHNIPCSGIWPVHSRYARMFNFRNAEPLISEDGTPIHGLRTSFGGFEVEIEAFCDTVRKCSCYIRYTVTNRASYRARERFGLVVRSGKEQALVYGAPDGYCTHLPEVAAFLYTPNTFAQNGTLLRDGMIFVRLQTAAELSYDEREGIVWANEYLEPGESYTIECLFGKGDNVPETFDYEAEKAKTRAFWQAELGKLRLPARTATDPARVKLIRHGTAQLLQCYAHYVDKDFLVPRQGSMQRFVWIWDQLPVLEAMSRLGEFSDYYRGAMATYFEHMQRPDGEICTWGENWATDTSCALYSFSAICMNAEDRELWEKYRARALDAFRWIMKKRRETGESAECVAGLFPPMRGSDWAQVFQNWKTDVWNLMGMELFLAACKHFGETDVAPLADECADYRRTLRAAFDEAVENQKGSDALHIPYMPRGDEKPLIEGFYPYLLHGVFVWAEIVEKQDVARVRTAMAREGLYRNGLYGHMPYRDGNSHVWYTTAPEIYWFRAYRRDGNDKDALEILHALLRYSMTDEFYMCERFCDNDPWYVPWMPNASGLGRLLTMMLDADDLDVSIP